MPVVAVQDIGLEVARDVPYGLEHSHGEEGHPLSIVELTVYLRAAEVVLIIEEIVSNSALSQGKESAVLTSPTEPYLIVLNELHLILVFLRDRAEKRKYDSGVKVFILDVSRQRPGDIAESSCFDERRCLERRK